MSFGIYVHIPFCASRCPYCDFNTYVDQDDLAPAYLDALIEEAELWAQRVLPPAGSIFIGGGTPTLLDPAGLVGMLDRLRATLVVRGDAEITVEANPETCDASALAVLRRAGVNRISIGAQSFSPPILQELGRTHSGARTRRAVGAARSAGFENLNLDLIYGTPGESPAAWRETLHEALSLEPDHLSCYALTIEPGTAFGAAVAAGRMPAPDGDDQAAKYEHAIETLRSAGYEHYEVSNWAKPGSRSRHNLVYWMQGDYAGLGAGAHSHLRGERWWNRKLPRDYIEHAAAPRAGSERLSAGERAAEWMQLRLRLPEGVALVELERTIGRDARATARTLHASGLVELDDGWMRPTVRGLLLNNEVVLAFLALAPAEC